MFRNCAWAFDSAIEGVATVPTIRVIAVLTEGVA